MAARIDQGLSAGCRAGVWMAARIDQGLSAGCRAGVWMAARIDQGLSAGCRAGVWMAARIDQGLSAGCRAGRGDSQATAAQGTISPMKTKSLQGQKQFLTVLVRRLVDQVEGRRECWTDRRFSSVAKAASYARPSKMTTPTKCLIVFILSGLKWWVQRNH